MFDLMQADKNSHWFKTPSENCQNTLEQGGKPTNAHIGPVMTWRLTQGWACLRPL